MAKKTFTATEVIARANEYGLSLKAQDDDVLVEMRDGTTINSRIEKALAKIKEYKPLLLAHLKYCCTTCGVHMDDVSTTASFHFTATGVPYCDDHLPPSEDVRLHPQTSEKAVQVDEKCIYCGADAEYHSPLGTGWCSSSVELDKKS